MWIGGLLVGSFFFFFSSSFFKVFFPLFFKTVLIQMSDCAQLSSCMHEKLASPNSVIVISKWNFLRSSLSAFLFLKGSTIIYIGKKLMFNLIFWEQDHRPLHAVCGQKVFRHSVLLYRNRMNKWTFFLQEVSKRFNLILLEEKRWKEVFSFRSHHLYEFFIVNLSISVNVCFSDHFVYFFIC